MVGGRGRGGFVALSLCSNLPLSSMCLGTHDLLSQAATPCSKGPALLHPVRGLAPVWEAGWAGVQQGAFWWLLVPWSTSQPGARAGSQSHPLPASGLLFYSPLWVLIP